MHRYFQNIPILANTLLVYMRYAGRKIHFLPNHSTIQFSNKSLTLPRDCEIGEEIKDYLISNNYIENDNDGSNNYYLTQVGYNKSVSYEKQQGIDVVSMELLEAFNMIIDKDNS